MKNLKSPITKWLHYAIVFVLLLNADCSEEKKIDDNETIETISHLPLLTEDEGIIGNKLVHVDLENNSFISFWEIGPGGIAIRYSRPVNDANGAIGIKLNEIATAKVNLVEAYKVLSPAPQARDIEVLKKAIERQPLRAQHFENYTDFKLALNKAKVSSEQFVEDEKSSLSEGRHACGEDFMSDWFRDNFCNYGAFRFCKTNQVQVSCRVEQSNYFEACGAAVNDTDGSQFYADYDYRGFTLRAWDFMINPRTIECWYINDPGNGYYSGFKEVTMSNVLRNPPNTTRIVRSACSRSHLSVGWGD